MDIDDARISDELKRTIKTIIKKEFQGNPRVVIEDGDGHGYGFLGSYMAIKIEDVTNTLNLFIKSCSDKNTYNKLSVPRLTFANEVWYYTKLHPTYLEFQLNHGIKDICDNIAKCYGTELLPAKEFIVLENLKSAGFKMFDPTKKMDDEHLLLVFETMAKIHGVAYALRDQQPDAYQELLSGMQETFFHCMGETKFDEAVKGNLDLYFEQCGNEMFPNDGDRLKKALLAGFYDARPKDGDKYSVVSQVDFWCNNIMFKYDQDGHPIDAKMFDFQFIGPNSPACDLTVLFYSIASKETMSNYLFYLNRYYTVLSKRIEELGSDPTKVYPYEVFREHWKRFSKFGFGIIFIILKLMFTDKDEVRDVDKHVNNGISDTFTYKSKNDYLFNDQVTCIFNHFIQNGFI